MRCIIIPCLETKQGAQQLAEVRPQLPGGGDEVADPALPAASRPPAHRTGVRAGGEGFAWLHTRLAFTSRPQALKSKLELDSPSPVLVARQGGDATSGCWRTSVWRGVPIPSPRHSSACTHLYSAG